MKIFDFLLKLYEKYLESKRKAADTTVILLFFSFVPIPIINVFYWILTGLKIILEDNQHIVSVVDFVIDVFLQDISTPIFVLIFIVAFLYFICRLYKYQIKYKKMKLYGVNIDLKFFKRINSRAIATLGERYSPSIHVENKELDALYRIVTEKVNKQDIIVSLKTVIAAEGRVDVSIDDSIKTEYLNKIQKLSEINSDDIDSGWFKELYSSIDELIKQREKCISKINRFEKYSFNSTKYDNFKTAIKDITKYKCQSWYQVLVDPAIAVIGEAGIGKSHLLADIAIQREVNNLDSILLLGQWFTSNKDLKEQILSQLSLRCNFEEFLEGLNTYGKKRKRRTYIIIDALNEGEISSWETELPSLIADIKRYKFIGIIFKKYHFFLSCFFKKLFLTFQIS